MSFEIIGMDMEILDSTLMYFEEGKAYMSNILIHPNFFYSTHYA